MAELLLGCESVCDVSYTPKASRQRIHTWLDCFMRRAILLNGMNLKKLAGYATVGVGALYAATRALRYTEKLERPLEGNRGSYRWRGMNIAYTEAGDPEDQDLLLYHGINAAGSAGEYRRIFDELSDQYHVIAPDLPGFGRSDRPPLRYSAPLYEDFVTEFTAEFDSPRVIASGLTAAYTVAAAREGVDGTAVEMSELLCICPTPVAGPTPSKRWLRELIRSPILGEGLFKLLSSKPSIRYFNADHGYYDMTKLSDSWLEYEWQTTHAENARFAPASFIAGHLNSQLNLSEELAELDAPTTILWGREAEITPLSMGRDMADEADCRLVVFDNAKLLPHVEFPEQFLQTVTDPATIEATV